MFRDSRSEVKAFKMVGFKIATVAALSSLALAAPSIQNHGASWKNKIKNVVVLVEENRSFDTFCGGLDYDPSINGLLHHNYCNSMWAEPYVDVFHGADKETGMPRTPFRKTMFALDPAQMMLPQMTQITASLVSTCNVRTIS